MQFPSCLFFNQYLYTLVLFLYSYAYVSSPLDSSALQSILCEDSFPSFLLTYLLLHSLSSVAHISLFFKELPPATKRLIQTRKNGEISWELEKGEQESGPSGEVGQAVYVTHWRTLRSRTFASDLAEI